MCAHKSSMILCLYLILTVGNANSQIAGARLEGTVRDASQAIIPGVAVTVTNEGTNISTTSITNDRGFYVFVTLPPGSYTLISELQGFKRYVQKGIVLQVGDTDLIQCNAVHSAVEKIADLLFVASFLSIRQCR